MEETIGELFLSMMPSIGLQYNYSRPAGCGHCRWSAARSSAAGGAGGMSPSRQDQLKHKKIFHLTLQLIYLLLTISFKILG